MYFCLASTKSFRPDCVDSREQPLPPRQWTRSKIMQRYRKAAKFKINEINATASRASTGALASAMACGDACPARQTERLHSCLGKNQIIASAASQFPRWVKCRMERGICNRRHGRSSRHRRHCCNKQTRRQNAVKVEDIRIGNYTDWNLFNKPFYEDRFCTLEGSFIAFAPTKLECIATGDPRTSTVVADRGTLSVKVHLCGGCKQSS